MKQETRFNKLAMMLLFGLIFACCVTLVGIDQARAQETLRIIAFGAHPDDCEIRAGGVAIKWAELGHKVKFVSITNGDIGHSIMAGGPLAQRRTREVEEAAEVMGIDETEVLDIHDGELMPTLENREKIIRLIREWEADLVLVNRPNDYHPDHRYTSILVQDAAFMVIVPFMCPDTPHLEKNPVFMYWPDRFQKPNPFEPDIAISIDDVLEQKYKALDKLESQFYEYGALGNGDPDSFFEGTLNERLNFLKRRFGSRYKVKPEWEPVVAKWYGEERAENIENVEAFEICEYGHQPSDEELRKLFPFFE